MNIDIAIKDFTGCFDNKAIVVLNHLVNLSMPHLPPFAETYFHCTISPHKYYIRKGCII